MEFPPAEFDSPQTLQGSDFLVDKKFIFFIFDDLVIEKNDVRQCNAKHHNSRTSKMSERI